LRTAIFLPAGLILTILFVVYRFSEIIQLGPQDKIVQLVLLVSAAACFALYAARRTGRDLVQLILGKIMKLSTVRFLGLLLVTLAVFSIWMAYVPFEGIPKGGDEAAYYFQSKIYAAGHLQE